MGEVDMNILTSMLRFPKPEHKKARKPLDTKRTNTPLSEALKIAEQLGADVLFLKTGEIISILFHKKKAWIAPPKNKMIDADDEGQKVERK